MCTLCPIVGNLYFSTNISISSSCQDLFMCRTFIMILPKTWLNISISVLCFYCFYYLFLWLLKVFYLDCVYFIYCLLILSHFTWYMGAFLFVSKKEYLYNVCLSSTSHIYYLLYNICLRPFLLHSDLSTSILCFTWLLGLCDWFIIFFIASKNVICVMKWLWLKVLVVQTPWFWIRVSH